MEIFYPKYYYDFRCIASACPDSCCKEWEVDIDPDSARAYRALPGPLGDRLREVIREEDGNAVMTITNGRCPMWRQDGLCRIQAELGHDALCQTCRDYPRLRHDYGDFVELGLELSCPEAARLIFSAPTFQLVESTASGGESPEYDIETMTILRRSREEILTFLEDLSHPLQEALAALLLFSHSVQSEIDGGDTAQLHFAQSLALAKKYAKSGDIFLMRDFFAGLEILTDRWKILLDNCRSDVPLSESLRPLAIYGIQRYWLQAVSDFDLVCRIKFVIAACLLVNSLGGDPVKTAQLFSKEIENDSDNMDAILDAAYTSPAFTDVQLLGLLIPPEKNQNPT